MPTVGGELELQTDNADLTRHGIWKASRLCTGTVSRVVTFGWKKREGDNSTRPLDISLVAELSWVRVIVFNAHL
jgi:hypothetical protein